MIGGSVNKKGFTLIELLTVIIILAMLVTIISIAADNTIRNSKIKLSETQIENKQYHEILPEDVFSFAFSKSNKKHICPSFLTIAFYVQIKP